MAAKTQKDFKTSALSAILMFIVGFVGISILGAAIVIILLSLGILPQI